MEATKKHFEFTGETKKIEIIRGKRITLHRIRATVDTIYARIGDIGGWVEKPENLCDNAWVSDDACVFGEALVGGDARVFGNARVSGNACVYDDARVSGNACVFGEALVGGNARVSDNACVYGDARVFGEAWVFGDARVFSAARVFGNADIKSNNDHCGFDLFGSANRHTHAYKTVDCEIQVTCGCFRGSIDEFAAKVEETHCGSEYEKQYKMIIELIELKLVV